jgi:hypothetical protein
MHLAAIVLLVLTSTLGMAQFNASRDEGQYEILQARYGTARNNVDVTSRLRDLARQDRTFRMGNSTFGVDPDRGAVKTLRIYARGRNGENRTFEYMEGSTVDGSIFTGWAGGHWGRNARNGGWGDDRRGDDRSGSGGDQGEYEILHARYGTARNNVDVTNRLRELARQDRSFRMGNSTFGVDPDPGALKSLRIYTRDRNGRNRMFEYTEGSTVDGSTFTGWSGGNWGRGGWNGGWGESNGGNGGGRPGIGGLSIVSATYGAGRQRRDVTGRLQSLIRDGRLSMTVDNAVLGGDPAPNLPKSLFVTFTNGRGRQQEVQINEGERLNIP